MAIELWKTCLYAGGATLFFLFVFVSFYWAFRGFPPASRVVIQSIPKQSDKKQDEATFYFFYVDWCPYSQEAKPKIESLREFVADYTYGGKFVHVEFVNCEVDKSKCELYKIDAYPAYRLETSQKLYTYEGPANVSVLREFLRSALGAEVIHTLVSPVN